MATGWTRGFLLQPTYRIESGRPVVHLWGRLEGGETFLVRDRRLTPHFYVRAADSELAGRLGATPLAATERRTLAGEPVLRAEVPTPPETPPLRNRLESAGVVTFQADIRFAMLYLIERGIRGSLGVRGESRPGRGVDRVYEDPELEPADWLPELSVLSFDIETDMNANEVLSVGLYGCGAAEVLLASEPHEGLPEAAVAAGSEAAMLRRFAQRVRELDPDVLTGWNAADFDFPVLLRSAERLGVSLELGRGPGATLRRAGRGRYQATQVLVPGRLVLDGPALVRGAFMRMERYSLDYVSRQVLGEGKTLHGDDRGEQIQRLFTEDPARFVEYNLTDARLVIEILERLQLVELAVARSRLTGLPPDRVASSVAAFDFLYLTELHRLRLVAPTVRQREEQIPAMGGGHVFQPEPGLYRNVVVLDVKSLYPSLIRSFHIDPLGYVARPGPDDDVVVAPNGAAFRRQEGILPRLLGELFPRREEAKAAGDQVASYAIKILMNSFFGVLGTPVCRFFNPEIANAITSFGRELLVWSRRRIEEGGRRVLYGDTDSLFIDSGVEDPAEALALGDALVEQLNRELAAHLEERWQVTSRLEVERERLYLRLFLPPARHGAAGARKRYAGLVEEGGERKVVFVGLEAVRRDWTKLARRAQREIYQRLFDDQPVEEYLKELVERLRGGQLDEELVYRKAMRKPPEAYTATSPPHVVAARKMSRRPGWLVSYVITVAGPEPAAEQEHPLDHEHYVARQIRPVAEPVLAEPDDAGV
ncbi:MAG: DNA polymerase II, partial [Thermoanaerobaculia bacterium]